MKRPHAINPPRMPAELEHLTAVLGDDLVLLLVEEYGGSRLFVPRLITDETVLALKIGRPAAEAMAAVFPAALLQIPACKPWRVRLYASRGWTVAKIALMLRWDETTVYRHLRNHQPISRHHQMDLF
jgi:hypothetical protein